jgi:hypothetical protein
LQLAGAQIARAPMEMSGAGKPPEPATIAPG